MERTEISSLGEFGLIDHLTRNNETKNASILNKNTKNRHSSEGWNPVEVQFEPARLNALRLSYFLSV